jgi:hypothetical protein
VSDLTTLQHLELRGGPLTAAAALVHLQALTRLTSLYMDSVLGDEDDDDDDDDTCYNYLFKNAVANGQV